MSGSTQARVTATFAFVWLARFQSVVSRSSPWSRFPWPGATLPKHLSADTYVAVRCSDGAARHRRLVSSPERTSSGVEEMLQRRQSIHAGFLLSLQTLLTRFVKRVQLPALQVEQIWVRWPERPVRHANLRREGMLPG